MPSWAVRRAGRMRPGHAAEPEEHGRAFALPFPTEPVGAAPGVGAALPARRRRMRPPRRRGVPGDTPCHDRRTLAPPPRQRPTRPTATCMAAPTSSASVPRFFHHHGRSAGACGKPIGDFLIGDSGASQTSVAECDRTVQPTWDNHSACFKNISPRHALTGRRCRVVTTPRRSSSSATGKMTWGSPARQRNVSGSTAACSSSLVRIASEAVPNGIMRHKTIVVTPHHVVE